MNFIAVIQGLCDRIYNEPNSCGYSSLHSFLILPFLCWLVKKYIKKLVCAVFYDSYEPFATLNLLQNTTRALLAAEKLFEPPDASLVFRISIKMNNRAVLNKLAVWNFAQNTEKKSWVKTCSFIHNKRLYILFECVKFFIFDLNF